MVDGSARFLPCPSCGRHVRSGEQLCPFCRYAQPGGGAVVQTTSGLPGRVSALLLGMCLIGCAGGKGEAESGKVDQPAKTDAGKDDAGKEDAGKTTADAPGDVKDSVGADGGDAAAEDPRPAEKYGAPPAMDEGPIEEPRPSVKYGGPPAPEPSPEPLPSE